MKFLSSIIVLIISVCSVYCEKNSDKNSNSNNAEKKVKISSNLRKNPKFSSNSFAFSSFSSFSNLNGKPEKHFRQMESEEFKEKNGDGPEEIRRYGEFISKDNEDPLKIKRKATTNMEKEEIILGNGEEEKISKNEKVKFIHKLFLIGFS
jgi:hypothetical protein